MNILILGGTGFIGTHLARSYEESGDSVTVIDNYSTSNSGGLKVLKNIDIVYNDITKMDDSILYPYIGNADKIYFLAGSVGVSNIDSNPYQTLLNNVDICRKLIPLFEKAQRHVIFTSSSEIYGSAEYAFSEDDPASIPSSLNTRGGYATSKLLTEFMITSSSFPYSIARLFNVVGSGQLSKYGMVLPRFIEKAKKNKPLAIYGTGEQIRSFCHVSDAVSLLQKITPEDKLINIGNSEDPITMTTLAMLVIKLLHSKSIISYKNPRSGEIMYRIPDMSMAINKYDYKPRYDLGDIIKEMM